MSKRTPRILCVDDEVMNLKLLEAILLPSGYEVVTAGDGHEALRKISERKVDCVLLDVMMPKMNGFDACRKIREDEETRHLPVVLITALTSREDRIRGIEAGADDFLSKPFDEGEVIARTKMLLGMKSLGDQLRSAYNDMIGMNAYAEKTISTFDDADFRLMSKVDGVVELLMRNGSGQDGPQSVLVRILGGTAGHEWHLYAANGGVRRTAVARDPVPDVSSTTPLRRSSRTIRTTNRRSGRLRGSSRNSASISGTSSATQATLFASSRSTTKTTFPGTRRPW